MPRRTPPARTTWLHWHRFALPLFASFLLAACASVPNPAASTSATVRHSDFQARLIVIDTHNRWQAMLDWHAARAEAGWMRITHAATSRVVELRWRGRRMWLRDNQARSPDWRPIAATELARHGIPLQPTELAGFLLGRIPPGFTADGHGTWHARRGRAHIIVRWHGNRLAVTDTTHGRRAVLIILKETAPRPHA